MNDAEWYAAYMGEGEFDDPPSPKVEIPEMRCIDCRVKYYGGAPCYCHHCGGHSFELLNETKRAQRL